MDRTLVIIPTYDERENVQAIARAIHEEVPEVDLLFVDDASPDGTGALVNARAEGEPRLHLLSRGGKLGLGTAYMDGFREAVRLGAELVIQMDCDLSHDPAALPALVEAAREADVVIGSRYVAGGGTENWGLGRRLISRGGGLYARAVLGLPIRDLTAGFVCYRRRVLEALDLGAVTSQGYGFQIEMKFRVVRAGFRVEEMPILFVDRRVGQSKMSKRIFLEALGLVWKLRFSAS